MIFLNFKAFLLQTTFTSRSITIHLRVQFVRSETIFPIPNTVGGFKMKKDTKVTLIFFGVALVALIVVAAIMR